MSSDEPSKEEYFVCRDMLILDVVRRVLDADLEELQLAEKSYGNSWKKRGGVGAFMMLARKWDRIEQQVRESEYDIFKAIKKDPSEVLYAANAAVLLTKVNPNVT